MLLEVGFLIFFCTHPISHPQQRPSGHYSSSGCHGEMFPAWSGLATRCEGRSHSHGSEFKFNLQYFLDVIHSLWNCCTILVHLILHLGQQQRNQIKCADWVPHWRKVGKFLSCTLPQMLYGKFELHLHLPAFSTVMQLQILSTIQKVSKSLWRLRWCDILNVIQTASPPTMTYTLLWLPGHPGEDPIEQLLKLEAHKVNTVKKVTARGRVLLK